MDTLDTSAQRELIEQCVKSNPKFSGNEDLLEDFCNETFRKTYIVFKSDKNEQQLKSYVGKVVNTSMTSVLKNYGRVKRVSSKFVRTDFVSIDQSRNEEQSLSYSFDIEDPGISPEAEAVNRDELLQIANKICYIDLRFPEKLYKNLFHCRYIREMKQREIAEELGISQSEVCKRLLKLSEFLKTDTDV